jgi:hypothetical protein
VGRFYRDEEEVWQFDISDPPWCTYRYRPGKIESGQRGNAAIRAWSRYFPSFEIVGDAGQIVYTNMYSPQSVIQGFGQTQEQAIQDAFSAMPPGYKLDPGNSWETEEVTQGDWMASRPVMKAEKAG